MNYIVVKPRLCILKVYDVLSKFMDDPIDILMVGVGHEFLLLVYLPIF